ncbi:DNA repair protein RadA [Rhodoferax sp. 4810]|uniref:DNA repair protein RadA n=1 Tax=Thiospirillum jenense TaxID=1653858 RepID=A0A839HD72_9GAMM|nr:DNA repair protein RadA [Rhodoferax jenense]MBB1126853.1 DNA repair protein RadA [Thiospirillum jenense]
MNKKITGFVCNACGVQLSKWSGQCPDCGGWNTISETPAFSPPASIKHRAGGYSGIGLSTRAIVQDLADLPVQAESRIPSGIDELDRVLGGGLVPGSVVLIGGDPGIGKSTLLLQACATFADSPAAQTIAPPVLYVSGEESAQQVKLRAHRLGLLQPRIRLLTETCVEHIIAIAIAERPQVLVIDSIQTLFVEELSSAPGSVAQVRESAARLVRYAKNGMTTVFLVGHVTKEGALAGPRVLEHMVDTVLYFEGEPGSAHRLVRAVKNRFGAVNELGVFAMTDKGLRQVTNPSAIFLSRHSSAVSGSAILVTREGTRPLLVEIQALVDESPLANPRRIAVGLDQNRLAMLLAVLHRHGGVAMFGRDVFVNAVGGVRITETAADLALVLAILSSERDCPLPPQLAVFGEIGLSGEIRPVPNGADRLREAAKHGMKQAIVPIANVPKEGVAGLEIHAVGSLRQAMEII